MHAPYSNQDFCLMIRKVKCGQICSYILPPPSRNCASRRIWPLSVRFTSSITAGNCGILEDAKASEGHLKDVYAKIEMS